MSLPETDPTESVNVSAADMAILAGELKTLRTQRDELLAALELMMRRGRCLAAMDKARAAIAKATGQEGGAA